MDKGRAPKLYTVPPHRAFADALVAGLMRRHTDPAALARGTILLPNNRGVRAVTEAFVRASGGALLLPRLAAIGDPELGEGLAAALDPIDTTVEPLPPAVGTLQRRLILARLVAETRARAGQPVEAEEAVRLAGDLARTLDQLLLEEVDPHRLAELDLAPELSEHWQRSLQLFEVILHRWPDELARLGMLDAAARRGKLLDRLTDRWRARPPAGFVCAAGISDAAPAVARLLRTVAELPAGSVVFAGLGTGLDQEEWDALGPHAPDPATGKRGPRPSETHPQYHLKQLLDRIGVGRAEVKRWRAASDHDAAPARSRAIASALAPADLTARWNELGPDDRRLSGVSAAEFTTSAAEAQGIALALREALETPGRTAALVTPDRALARRVATHLKRWDVTIDDSAGRPLGLLPPGTMLLALAEAAAGDWAPLDLLALLKHPLVRSGDARLEWLDGVRVLDRALRGPRPAPGLDGVSAHLEQGDPRTERVRRAAAAWWPEARRCLEPVGRTWGRGAQSMAGLVACLREAAGALCGEEIWSGPAGRCAAQFLTDLEEHAPAGPATIDPADLAGLLRTLMDETAVRPSGGAHPRLAILGLIEARLQHADLMVLAGLNEGSWPGLPAPDPWLAPRIRRELGLPGLDWRIGVAAHDFGQSLGAPQVLLTRSRREPSGPALPSRFWLRLEALAGERFDRARDLEGWADALDDPGDHRPADRPAPVPPPGLRPTQISVTEVDRLKADPYAFYARRVLGLGPLDPVDADPSAAWRGSAVHLILEQWWRRTGCAPGALAPLARDMLLDERTHPMVRALWEPRLMEAIDWIDARVTEDAAEGRRVVGAEVSGAATIAGVRLTGRFDRVDRLPDGSLVIVDYKTGQPPSVAAVREGYSLQLGMLGVIAERGGFEGLTGTAGAFEYWSLAKKGDAFGSVSTPVDPDGKRDRIPTADFTAVAARAFAEAAEMWLTGAEPFTAKLHPEYAPYAEYDQLMRRDEWYGRDR